MHSTDNYNQKLQFIEYLEFAAESLDKISTGKPSPKKPNNEASQNQSPDRKDQSPEKLELERLVMEHRLNELNQNQNQLELEKWILRPEN